MRLLLNGLVVMISACHDDKSRETRVRLSVPRDLPNGGLSHANNRSSPVGESPSYLRYEFFTFLHL